MSIWNKKSLPFIIFGFFLLIIWGIEFGVIAFFLQESPQVKLLEEYQPSLITKIYAENGEVIADFFAEKRILSSLQDIPDYIQQAIIVTEDANFYHHWGIDFRGIIRALKVNILSGGTVQGASTITQQLARNLFLTKERTLERKIREAILALQIEKKYSKDEILELYLNQIYFGRGAYGITAASWNYFGKPLNQLNLSEATFLAGLPRAPGFYSPFRNQKRAMERRDYVLNRMFKSGYISREEKEAAQNFPIEFKKARPSAYHKAPYFVEYVRKYLEAKYGEDLLYRGGLKVYTTLDPELQEIAETVLIEQLELFDKNHPHIKKSKGKDKEPLKLQGALIAIEPGTGYIKTMVGGRNFQESVFNRAVQAYRQPGSAFKPFVYSVAIEKGWRASDIIDDSPLVYDFKENQIYELSNERELGNFKEFIEKEKEKIEMDVNLTGREKNRQKKAIEERYWAPENYEKDFFGPVTLAKALERSRNIVTIKLLNQVGFKNIISYSEKMLHSQGNLGPHYSLALGTSEITPLEMACGYTVFANHGIGAQPIAIKTVLDSNGNILEENLPQEKEIIQEDTAYIITKMLEGVILRGTGWQARIGRPAAGKTGTTNDYTETWFAGYTPELVTVVYAGYDDRTSLGEKQTGGQVAAPIWADFMKKAFQDKPVTDFEKPEDIVLVQIDPYTGFLAQDYCPEKIEMPFKKGTEPVQICDCMGKERKRKNKSIDDFPDTF